MHLFDKTIFVERQKVDQGMAADEISDTTGLGDALSGQLVVLLEASSNPMTDSASETYVPPPGYILNTPRFAWFNELHVLGSPYVPTGEITMDGNTLSPQEIVYSVTTPSPRKVLVDSNDKNQEKVFYDTKGDKHQPRTRALFCKRSLGQHVYPEVIKRSIFHA